MHTTIETGSRLDPDVRLAEGPALTMVMGAPVELLIALKRPHELEVQAVTTAPTQFAWIDGADTGVLLYRLGPVLPWAQVAYHPHLIAAEEGTPGVDAGRGVRITLADLDTRVVRAVHRVRWPAGFARAVGATVTRLEEKPYDRLAYQHAVAALHRRFPTAEDLLIERADAQCTASPMH
ncbi:hypothetical protein [Symbioplanes lichenis]|uniref:hypothetical protein n=1 Tax=Symbioplanes lichenis TaxID=1629072 RepID=UPI002739B054|nr:hypothetical protein [Actinoplanes lichenis]